MSTAVQPIATPTGKALHDNHGRKIDYLRLSITDRCNLRCKYCMAEDGVKFLPHPSVLSYEELERLVVITKELGISKVRITGGEPFARKGCIGFLTRLKELHGVENLFITTNGIALAPHLSTLHRIGISGINMSLDTLDAKRFHQITRRDALHDVMEVFDEILRLAIPLKINSVIQEDTPDSDIIAMAGLIEKNPISLRFIEYMPFSGEQQCDVSWQSSLENRLHQLFPGLMEVKSEKIETARKFLLPGAAGTLGIIEGHSRKFCGHCNKIRITPLGVLKNCLYDHGVLDLRELLRNGASDKEIGSAITACVSRRYQDGLAVEKAGGAVGHESMAKIGG